LQYGYSDGKVHVCRNALFYGADYKNGTEAALFYREKFPMPG
jgi:hypothetical protein